MNMKAFLLFIYFLDNEDWSHFPTNQLLCPCHYLKNKKAFMPMFILGTWLVTFSH